jgi:hypothetical protein
LALQAMQQQALLDGEVGLKLLVYEALSY